MCMYITHWCVFLFVPFSPTSLTSDFVPLRVNMYLYGYKETFYFAFFFFFFGGSQPSNTDTAKPTYTLLQKQSSGCYSLSITSNPDEEWREVRHTGPVQKYVLCHILFVIGGHISSFYSCY